MLITCWSVKGGSGTTVVAAAIALMAAERLGDTWFVDLAGDGPAVLGAAEPAGPGIGDWLMSPASVGVEAIARLPIPVGGGLSLIPLGARRQPTGPRWQLLAEALAVAPQVSVVDLGTAPPPGPLHERAAHDVLVVRPCYLALRRAAALTRPPTAVVMVNEPGRALKKADVEHVTGSPVVAELEWDVSVARAVDAGLLAGRLPRSLRTGLGGTPWAA